MKTKTVFTVLLKISLFLILSACASNTTVVAQTISQGSFTLTGIPARYNGMFAILYSNGGNFLGGSNVTNLGMGWWNDSPPIQNGTRFVATRISNGQVVIPMWIIRNMRADNTPRVAERYIGNHNNVTLSVMIFNNETIVYDSRWNASGVNQDVALWNSLISIRFEGVRFRDGNARGAWDGDNSFVIPADVRN